MSPTPLRRPAGAFVLSLLLAVAGPGGDAAAASAAPVAAKNGMVVSAQHLATEVGVEVLKKGGNAIDAAVAVGYALAVVYPAAGNLGGGGFMTLQLADGRKTFFDFREKAPLAATPSMYLDAAGNVIRQASTHGHLAVARARHRRRPRGGAARSTARMKRAELIAPAIRLAEQGFVLEQGDADMLAAATAELRADPPTAAIFLNQGRPWVAGDRLVQRDLAATLRQIAEAGAAGFYKGPVAEALVASSRAGKGLITQADLDRYTSRELAPIECDYRGYRIVSAPPPSSGGVVLCEMLNILEGYPLQGLGLPLGRRRARADRGDAPRLRRPQQHLGDPDFVANPVDAPRSTRPMRRRSAPRSTRSGRRCRSTSRPARRRTRAATPRTTRSSTARATRSR